MYKAATFALALAASPAVARDQVIAVETFSYPSPATVHLDITLRELAQKAVATCGTAEQVVGLVDLDIRIRKGVNDPVAKLSRDTDTAAPTFDLWYPKIAAEATVRCAD